MYFNAQQLTEFFTNPAVNEKIKSTYHIALPWAEAGIDGKINTNRYYEQLVDVNSFDYHSVNMEKVVEVMHERIADGQFLNWKALRPWVVCDVTAGLPQDQPWIGWEIETGWNSREERKRVIDLFNVRYDYNCTDAEGYGDHHVELTFSPQTPDYYSKRDNPLHPLLFVANHKARANEHSARSMVGTHVNFSTPAFRAAHYRVQNEVEGAINNSLANLNYAEKEELFGRGSLYAGCFLRGDNYEESVEGVRWLEGKLFNSTYDWDVAKGYINVANNLCTVMEQLAAKGSELGIVKVSNFYAMLKGTEDTIVTERASYLRDGDDVADDEDDDWDDDDVRNPPPNGEWTNDAGEGWCSTCACYH